MTPTPWPPTPEQLEAWAKEASRTSSLLNYVEGDDPLGDIAAFLRSPRLREALELAEAVAWCDEMYVMFARAPGPADSTPWWCEDSENRVQYGRTLVEAVRSLREKIEKEGASS